MTDEPEHAPCPCGKPIERKIYWNQREQKNILEPLVKWRGRKYCCRECYLIFKMPGGRRRQDKVGPLDTWPEWMKITKPFR